MDVEYQLLAGDPGLVKRKGEEYQQIASAIRDSVTLLDDIVDQVDQKGLAMEATRDLARDVATDIRKATDRYQATGDALVTYAAELDRTREESRASVREIGLVEGNLATWRGIVRSRQDDYDTAVAGGDAQTIADARRRLRNGEDHVLGLETDLETHRRAWEQARDDKVVAATLAAEAIHDAVEGEGGRDLNDTDWDRFGVVLDWVKVICDIAAVLSIFLAWVPILGQVLLVLAAIGAIISIVDAFGKMLSGEGSFGDFLGALVLGVLSLYGGKIIGLLAKRLHMRALTQLPPKIQVPDATTKAKIVTDLLPRQTNGVGAFLKSPFVRSTADAHRYLERVTGSKFLPLLKDALKQSNPFNLRNALKFDSEVANIHNLVDGLSLFVDTPTLRMIHGLTLVEVGHTVYKNVDAITDVADVVKNGEGWEIVVESLQGYLGLFDGPVPGIAEGVVGVGQGIGDAVGNGTN